MLNFWKIKLKLIKCGLAVLVVRFFCFNTKIYSANYSAKNLNKKELPAGKYYVVAHTPAGSFSKRCMVKK